MKKYLLFLVISAVSLSLHAVTPKKIAVVGATSDIGKELIKNLLMRNHRVIALDSDEHALAEFQSQQGAKLMSLPIDLKDPAEAQKVFKEAIVELDGLDICILCCSIAPEIEEYGLLREGDIPWITSKETIDVNVMGTTALANVALNYFIDQKKGYLVGISSLDALHGHPGCPCYTASKAFMSNYLHGMRLKCARLKLHNIYLCDIRWSFVSQIKDSLSVGWTETPQEAAVQILKAIEQRKPVAYIMTRWSFALWALMAIPNILKNAVSGISGIKRYIR